MRYDYSTRQVLLPGPGRVVPFVAEEVNFQHPAPEYSTAVHSAGHFLSLFFVSAKAGRIQYLKTHVHTLGSMVPANTYRNDEYGGMDFSHDSDDSSDRARYHHRSLSAAAAVAEDYEVDYDSHGVKRGGNNHFGSTGILKCLTCRKRKGKVSSPSP